MVELDSGGLLDFRLQRIPMAGRVGRTGHGTLLAAANDPRGLAPRASFRRLNHP